MLKTRKVVVVILWYWQVTSHFSQHHQRLPVHSSFGAVICRYRTNYSFFQQSDHLDGCLHLLFTSNSTAISMMRKQLYSNRIMQSFKPLAQKVRFVLPPCTVLSPNSHLGEEANHNEYCSQRKPVFVYSWYAQLTSGVRALNQTHVPANFELVMWLEVVASFSYTFPIVYKQPPHKLLPSNFISNRMLNIMRACIDILKHICF